MTSLTEFLLARIAEDKARVASLTDDDWESEFGWQSFNGTEEPFLSAVLAVKPSRVLAECEAKRRIVEKYGEWHGHDLPAGVSEGRDWDEAERDQWVKDALLGVLETLAEPHADRPDYLPEWGPDPVNAESAPAG